MKRALLLLLLPLLLSGCGLVSDTPLSSERSAPRDNRLQGIWRPKDTSNHSYYYVAYGPANTGSILTFGKNDSIAGKSQLDLHRYNFFVTQTPKYSFLDVIEVSAETGKAPSNKPPAWSFIKYRFTWTGALEANLVAGEAFENAVRAGILRGTVDNHNVTVRHAPPGRLLSIIESSNPKDVFEPPGYAKKIAGP